MFYIGETDETQVFSMQNISESDVAFVTLLELDIKHTHIVVQFNDKAMGQEFALKLRCTIVREVKMEDKRLYMDVVLMGQIRFFSLYIHA